MLTLFTVFHVVIALLLILFVMLQDPKGGGAFGMGGGGGSSQTIFGSTGASNFLTTTTKWLAAIFAATSIGLAFTGGGTESGVMDGFVPPAEETSAATGADPVKEKNAEPKKEEENSQ